MCPYYSKCRRLLASNLYAFLGTVFPAGWGCVAASALRRSLQKEIWSKIESGAIRPSVYKIFPFEDAEKAQEVLERGENIGKVFLSMRE